MLPGSGSRYYLSSIKRTWMEAKADCEAKGAMLICPETEAELTVVRGFLKTSKLSVLLRFCFFIHYIKAVCREH